MKAEAQQPKFEFKRFLKIGHKVKPKPAAEPKQLPTPASSRSTSPTPARPGAQTPRSISSVNVPFADDHGLEKRYGKFGKVLGVGAGGSVQVLTRPDNGQAVAVKRFRTRHVLEDEQAYVKKITAEYTIGSMIHHGNVIKTLDMIKERGYWYEVMEYAPFDLFESVTSRHMSTEEIHCTFVQILRGANHMHRLGFAHRDLKLENVVVNDQGIMKLIDFGSATVFKYPSSDEIMLAHGNVGCDPYMAPEIHTGKPYDPRAVDVWSLAMIYCCMVFRSFPFKTARQSDSVFKKFSATPSPNPSSTSESTDTLLGPQSLLARLPQASRTLIGGMLDLNPSRRLTLRQVLESPFIVGISTCSQEENGTVHSGAGHTHTLASGNPNIPAK